MPTIKMNNREITDLRQAHNHGVTRLEISAGRGETFIATETLKYGRPSYIIRRTAGEWGSAIALDGASKNVMLDWARASLEALR